MSKTTKKSKVEESALETTRQAQNEIQPEAITEPVTTEEIDEKDAKSEVESKTPYLAAKKKIDHDKFYPIKKAVELVKQTSFSKFEGKIEAHINTFDIGTVGEITFPHLDRGSKKIVVLNDAILKDIKAGTIDFDILIATPATMPKLLPFARLLGPKGLMPNPKNGTLTDKPEDAVKKLSVAKTILKTEKKSAVVHTIVGKTSQEDQEIIANINELIRIIKPVKIKKLTICATMGPGIKIDINS
ncbi:MAG: 50S ribosomal protein L1 [Candidatus Shapirobacteria bacterium GW2011_GWE1_38_92]|uniref:Large ribosomal subunit protein uL1 n=1 Tax=Candidatus Shapirobacteria bacterium GW2011_GWE1_38_92 TaxID=1618489 RepID=A0A0G0LS68_9BACT|nr:MAG: 50S ribosomal protein L1 [Candidatus Shapirobacteria bacterium GW2011_GWE1_38_92]